MNERSAHDEGQRRAAIKIVEQTYVQYYRLKLEQGEVPHEAFKNREFQEAYSFIKQSKKEKFDNVKKTVLITVNPPESVDDFNGQKERLTAIVKKVASYKNVISENAEWSLEQRSDDPDNPYGMHCHIVSSVTGLSKSEYITRVYNATRCVFKGWDLSRNWVNVKFGNSGYFDYIKQSKHVDSSFDLGYQGLCMKLITDK